MATDTIIPGDPTSGRSRSTSFAIAKPPRASLFDKITYGIGSIAFGVKDNGFSVLLLLFYNQALGLSAQSVGFAIMVALFVDAFADPFIGNWSDHLRSRLGRRHPFMYAAALPVAVSYYFLWNPPAGLGEGQLLAYLIVISIVIRICISLYEVPSSALVADLTQDYEERTRFLSYRYFFGWVGGLTMGVAAFSVFLRPSPSDPSGQLNLEGYSNYGLTASLIMVTAIVISSLGTQRRAASFAQPPPRPPFDLARSAGELKETLSNNGFLALLFSSFFAYASIGIAGAVLTYFRIYFWELTGDQISFLMVGNFASVAVALVFAPRFAAVVGKKRAALTFSMLSILLGPLPVVLRLYGIMPPNGSDLLYWILFTSSFVATILSMSGGIVGSSMMADVVEDSAKTTGRHSAGLFFSANAFVLKCVSGVGVLGAGTILDLVGFPQGAKQGEVPADVLWRLGTIEPAIAAGLAFIAFLCLLSYPITREVHEDNLRKLRERDSRLLRPEVTVLEETIEDPRSPATA